MKDFMPDAGERTEVQAGVFSQDKSVKLNVVETKPNLNNTENYEESVQKLLHHYDIGSKLRNLRLRKKIALVDLGKNTGLSASMLSQLENGKLLPTLPTLARIATAFDVGLDHFFSDRRPRRTFSIVRASERLSFPDLSDSPVPGSFFEVLAFGSPDKSMCSYMAEFPRREGRETRFHQHEGAEFVHVLEGEVTINYGGEDHFLQAGDSVYFDASETHSYSGTSDSTARAIVVTTSAKA